MVYQLVLALAKNQSLKVPESCGWRAQGWHGVGVSDRDKMKWVVDISISTDRDITARRSDIIMYLKEHNQIVILEVAVAWEPLLEEQEKEKSNKYQELKVDVMAVVVGNLGVLRSFRSNIGCLKLFSKRGPQINP